MQAHPQSSSAARIHSTSRIAPTAIPSGIVSDVNSHPSSRVRLRDKSSVLAVSPANTLADTAGLAHDAGNLLAGLGLYCDLLSVPGVLRPEHRHYAEELSLISNRSAELIRRLIAAPALTGKAAPPLADEAAPLNSTQSPAADSQPAAPGISGRRNRRLSDRAAANDPFGLLALAPVLQGVAGGAATVIVTCGASLPSLHLPREVIDRIVVNLVRNASEAIRLQRSRDSEDGSAANLPNRGEIRIALAVVCGRLQLTVEDNGPGMPPAVAAAFLQPSALPRGASCGLGHRIVHELATGSSAQLSIRVRPGKGTLFCLKWPLPSTLLAEHLPVELPPALSMKPPQEGSIPC